MASQAQSSSNSKTTDLSLTSINYGLSVIKKNLKEPFILAGGASLTLLGSSRVTADIDVMLRSQTALVEVMELLGEE